MFSQVVQSQDTAVSNRGGIPAGTPPDSSRQASQDTGYL